MQFASALRSSPRFGGETNVYLAHRTDNLDRRMGNGNRVEKVPGSGTSIIVRAAASMPRTGPLCFRLTGSARRGAIADFW